MHKSLVDLLVDPVSKSPLRLEEGESAGDGRVATGKLRGPEGRSYVIRNGIPRFVLTEDSGQRQTEDSFGFKWQRRDSYNSPGMQEHFRGWFLKRYGFASAEELRGYAAQRGRILDAGCGSGFSAAIWLHPSWRGGGKAQWFGADISAAIDVAQERLGDVPGTHFLQADVCQLPFREQSFDAVFSEGVLHHTPSTERALKALAPLLRSGGELLFYIYRKKGPIREFADDYVRDIVSGLPPQEAWALLRPLTKLGQALAKLHAEIEVPEDVPYLGIKAGRYDVQRLVYWNFLKLFWNESYSFEENHHVNFDWYHPRYAHRQSEDEVRRWCAEAGLRVVHWDAQESGFTARAIKG
jgi:arsenite methyltransferase